MILCSMRSNPLFQDQHRLILLPPFYKEYHDLEVKFNKMINEQCQLPPYSFRINLKNISSHIFIDLYGLHKTFSCTTKKCENKKVNFLSSSQIGTGSVNFSTFLIPYYFSLLRTLG